MEVQTHPTSSCGISLQHDLSAGVCLWTVRHEFSLAGSQLRDRSRTLAVSRLGIKSKDSCIRAPSRAAWQTAGQAHTFTVSRLGMAACNRSACCCFTFVDAKFRMTSCCARNVQASATHNISMQGHARIGASDCQPPAGGACCASPQSSMRLQAASDELRKGNPQHAGGSNAVVIRLPWLKAGR